MADFRQIHTRIWEDAWFSDLSPNGKLLFIYLFSNSQTSICGIYELTIKTMSYHTGLSRETINQLLAEFEKSEKVYYRDGFIWVKNLRKYNETDSGKVFGKIVKDLRGIPAGELKQMYCEYHKIPYRYPIDTTPEKYPETETETETIQIQIQKRDRKETDTDTETPADRVSEEIQETPYPIPPELELYREVTGGLLPDYMNEQRVKENILAIRTRLKNPPREVLREYLGKKYAEWCASKTVDGKPYNPTNPKWLEWGITNFTPAAPTKPKERTFAEVY